MKTYARIDNGVVAEIFKTEDNIFKLFHPDIVFVEVGSKTVDVGYIFDGQDFFKPVSQPSTQAKIIAEYEAALDAYLDAVAQQHRYRDRVTFAMRAGYAGPWQSEGVKFGTWMDTCNAQAYALLESVLAGEAELPSKEDFIASLPEFAL